MKTLNVEYGELVMRLAARTSGRNRYELYKLNIDRCERYLLYISDGREGEFEIIGADANDAEQLFADISHAELSPEHLCDVVEDYKHMQKILNFE